MNKMMRLSLLKRTTVVRLQCLVSSCIVLVSSVLITRDYCTFDGSQPLTVTGHQDRSCEQGQGRLAAGQDSCRQGSWPEAAAGSCPVAPDAAALHLDPYCKHRHKFKLFADVLSRVLALFLEVLTFTTLGVRVMCAILCDNPKSDPPQQK